MLLRSTRRSWNSERKGKSMKRFAGFPAGKVSFTPLPNLLFSELLPNIDDLNELKVTLHLFWLLSHKKGYPRCVSLTELLGDGTLLRGLKESEQSPENILLAALAKAVARGTLLKITTQRDSGEREDWYFLNTDQSRHTLEKAQRGELQLAGTPITPGPELQPERPNIFTLYEQNIGILQPIIAEELAQAQKEYPADWIEEAFRLAAESNIRRWRYVRRILERWATEGKDDGKPRPDTEEARRRYIEGKYADYIEH